MKPGKLSDEAGPLLRIILVEPSDTKPCSDLLRNSEPIQAPHAAASHVNKAAVRSICLERENSSP